MTKIVLRTLVIALLADLPKSKTEQFNKAFELYRKSPHKNLGVERRLNMAGFTEDGLQNLLYDLKQLHGISDVEVKNYKKEVCADIATEDVIQISSVFEKLQEMTTDEVLEWAKTDCVGAGVGLDEAIELAEENELPELVSIFKLAKDQIELENHKQNI